ncbi:DUF2207 domain-containing protein [Desulfovibrio sp. SGI.169]|uniref:DUF2207 domain-containing protein n=1 Tax=Desulfovibrio sp. SGI.169 TaxID=3420561 RepID=UPI003CFDE73E
MKRFCLTALWLLPLVFLLSRADVALADERILDYAVSARLEEDASLVVTERIVVNIEQEAIRHGIYRLYPVKERVGEDGLRHYGFEVLSATLDGKAVPYKESDQGFTVGVAIGNPNVMAPLGKHTYELVYKTTGHVRFLEDHDEIYYNVTGNFWEFPIDHASFSLALPKGGAPLMTGAYTGKRGVNGAEYRMTGPSSFETTRPFDVGEGLTVVVGWEKGLIPQPPETLANIMGANRLPILFGIPLVQLLVFLLLSCVWTHRKKTTVIPLFSAPDGMSPGAVACLRKRGFTALLLQADILWAAVNGYLNMSLRDKKTILLTKTDPAQKKRSRPLAEWVRNGLDYVSFALFTLRGSSAVIDMRKDKERKKDKNDNEEKGVLLKSYLRLQGKYEDTLEPMWKFSRIPGIISAILGVGLLYLAMNKGIFYPGLVIDAYYSAETMLAVPGGVVALAVLFGYGFRKSRASFSGFRRIAAMATSLCMIFVLAFVLYVLVDGDMVFYTCFSVSILLAIRSGFKTCVKLTDKGNKMDAMIRGLEMYIRTAEKNRLAKINAPEDTVEKYEEILPYAAALGCADAWQKRFEPLLSHLDYVPDWMEKDEELAGGFNFVTYTTIIKTISMPSDLTSAISSAASQYAAATSGFFSSSGSSGSGSDSGYSGGSSGGGSGGGGGGGW